MGHCEPAGDLEGGAENLGTHEFRHDASGVCKQMNKNERGSKTAFFFPGSKGSPKREDRSVTSQEFRRRKGSRRK